MAFEINIKVESSTIFDAMEKIVQNTSQEITSFINNKSYKSELLKLVENKSPINKKDISEQSGVYIIMVTKKIELNKEFDNAKYGAKTNKNMSELVLNENDILYLGKTEGSLRKRIEEHLSDQDEKPYSLKLSLKERENIKDTLSLFAFELKPNYKNYKKTILASVESTLHTLLKPKVGSRRA